MRGSFFPLSDARDDNFVAGLSMGGYGAMKLALSHPDRFAAAASLSGAMDVEATRSGSLGSDRDRLFRQIWGDESISGTPNDLFWLLDQCARSGGPRPKLYQCCGTEDFLYEQNLRFRDVVRRTDYDYTYEEGPGAHDWAYWDAKIQDVLAWLPLRSK